MAPRAPLHYCGKAKTMCVRERQRKEESVGEKKEKKKKEKGRLPETVYDKSKQPVQSQQSFDSGQRGVQATKEQRGSLGELLKEGNVIYRDPHTEGRERVDDALSWCGIFFFLS